MVSKKDLSSLLAATDNMTLSEWKFISNVITNAFENKALNYQRQLKFKDLNKKTISNHLELNLFGDNLDE